MVWCGIAIYWMVVKPIAWISFWFDTWLFCVFVHDRKQRQMVNSYQWWILSCFPNNFTKILFLCCFSFILLYLLYRSTVFLWLILFAFHVQDLWLNLINNEKKYISYTYVERREELLGKWWCFWILKRKKDFWKW